MESQDLSQEQLILEMERLTISNSEEALVMREKDSLILIAKLLTKEFYLWKKAVETDDRQEKYMIEKEIIVLEVAAYYFCENILLDSRASKEITIEPYLYNNAARIHEIRNHLVIPEERKQEIINRLIENHHVTRPSESVRMSLWNQTPYVTVSDQRIRLDNLQSGNRHLIYQIFEKTGWMDENVIRELQKMTEFDHKENLLDYPEDSIQKQLEGVFGKVTQRSKKA